MQHLTKILELLSKNELHKFYFCQMANNTSPHILSTSANLLGFCLFVITSLHISNQIETHIIDEFTSIIAALLTFSCIFSFISIRTKIPEREYQFETIADYFFISGLYGDFSYHITNNDELY